MRRRRILARGAVDSIAAGILLILIAATGSMPASRAELLRGVLLPLELDDGGERHHPYDQQSAMGGKKLEHWNYGMEFLRNSIASATLSAATTTTTTTTTTAPSWRPRSTKPTTLSQGCRQHVASSTSFGHFVNACRKTPELAIVAYEGMREAMDACAEVQRFAVWSCAAKPDFLTEPDVLARARPETAFVLALTAAGAAWGVGEACAQGWLEACDCGPSSKERRSVSGDFQSDDSAVQFKWTGCAQTIPFALAASRKLLTRTNRSSSSSDGATPSLPLHVEKHNLKAGRMAFKQSARSVCRCHGVSGSCQQRTCWRRAAPLATLVARIQRSYDRARRVSSDRLSPRSLLHPHGTQAAAQSSTTPRAADLIYTESSPFNPCESARGRVCAWRNETHAEGDCSKLCCGRRFSVEHEVLRYQCGCRVRRCCTLECNECQQHRWISTCL